MDRAMPEMNGEQTARFMKKSTGDVPSFCSPVSAETTWKSRPTAMDVVLNKPITLETLRHTISKIVYAA